MLARLAVEAEAGGDLRGAVTHTRRMVALDPLAEEGQRELIRRLAASGDRAAALTAYSRYSERLRTELRIAPSPATRELVDELRGGNLEPEPGSVEREPGGAEAKSAGAEPAGQTASGTVTLLFTDLVGSTELLDELGDEEAERRRRIHFAILRDVALSHAGQEVKNLGRRLDGGLREQPRRRCLRGRDPAGRSPRESARGSGADAGPRRSQRRRADPR